MKSKYLVGIFLFIFWMLATALVTAGLLSRQQSAKLSTCALPSVTDAGASGSANSQTALTVEEVAKHNTAKSCWMIVNGKVYDLTSLVATHSGGSQQILNDCGREGSVGFNTKYQGQSHSGSAQSIIQSYYLGDLGAKVNATQTSQKINSVPHGRSGEDD